MAKSKSPIPNLAVTNPFIAELDLLSKKRANFEKQLARTNKTLYQLLAEVYAQYELAAQAGKLSHAVHVMKQKLKAQGKKVQSGTPEINVYVRYVFGTDRQRVYNYATCLQAAITKSIPSTGFVEFITKIGGIEECKLQTTAGQKVGTPSATAASSSPSEQQMQAASALMDSGRFSFVADLALPKTLAAKVADQELAMLIGKPTADGTLQVITTVPVISNAQKNLVKRELAKVIADQEAEQAIRSEEQQERDVITSLLAQTKFTTNTLNESAVQPTLSVESI
jgi:hypothetical protein